MVGCMDLLMGPDSPPPPYNPFRSISQLFLQHTLISNASPARTAPATRLSIIFRAPHLRKSGTGQSIPSALWLLSTATPAKSIRWKKKGVYDMTPASHAGLEFETLDYLLRCPVQT